MTVGPFELWGEIGAGGMGRVFKGQHPQTGVEVAVKVISRGADEQSRQRFRREVQAHAGLIHPNVVYLFEYGTVSAESARASGGNLVEDSPFVAMELAGAGTLRDLAPVSNYSRVQRILLEVLDGLAFSHARGVIHRDIKPENLLVFQSDGQGEERMQIKLADFGIAHALEQPTEDNQELASVSGTPSYMAPEQGRGQWRAYGPWTDLYAVGCVAWELICGYPPFRGPSAMAILVQHLTVDRPALKPGFPVPDGLEDWIHRAMAIDRERRFECAADAARALLSIGDAPAEQPGSSDQAASSDVSSLGPTLIALAPTLPMKTFDPMKTDASKQARASSHRDVNPTVALVPQTAFLFDDTVRGNITLGADIPDDVVWSALRDAQADGFVA
ncbi:MAG: protein kinase domain-containing protein, partial [Bradymonadaceae bacterium]